MAAFWDVLWTDAKATILFVAPLMLLSLPASLVGALLGTLRQGAASWGQLRRIVWRGALIGTGAAFVLSMIVQFLTTSEGLPLAFGRQAFRDQGLPPLIFASVVVAFLGAYLITRRTPADATDVLRPSYTLRQLFVGQIIIGLLLVWWTYTRRNELGQRRVELAWETREQSLNEIFGPYGWYVKTWHDKKDIELWPSANPASKVVTDSTLALVARQGNVVDVRIKSDSVTDEGLARLATAKNMKLVEVASSRVTDEGIHALCEAPGLETLIVDSPLITLDGLKKMPRPKSLQMVQVRSLVLTRDEYSELRAVRPDVHWGIPWKE